MMLPVASVRMNVVIELLLLSIFILFFYLMMNALAPFGKKGYLFHGFLESKFDSYYEIQFVSVARETYHYAI